MSICQDTDNGFMLSTWKSPLPTVQLSKNVRVRSRKRKLVHGNRLVWKIEGKVAKVAYSFCLLVILWRQQKSARISYSFIVLSHCLQTVLSALLARSDSGGKFC